MQPAVSQRTLKTCRRWFIAALAAGIGLAAIGCASPAVRSQSPEPDEAADAGTTVELVGDVARAWGMNFVKVEGVALVNGLAETGSDPPPSPPREMLMADMRSHKVGRPNQYLASPTTSLVLLRGFLPPGIQKGDRFDVEVRTAPRSETTSLAGGWLMLSRLRDVAVLDNEIHQGHVLGLVRGSVLTDALTDDSQDDELQTRGLVPGGGAAAKSRTLGLVLRKDGPSALASATYVSTRINTRFHTFDQGVKTGVTKPIRDNFLELIVHPRYQDNIARYMRVVRSIPLGESPSDRAARMRLLERQLQEPTSTAAAALRLEAIGKDSVDTLARGIKSEDPEICFYAAAALAYLDDPRAAVPLAETARHEPAFRWHALTALGTMDDMAAYDALTGLLHVTSAETRYGAFRQIRIINAKDPLVRGEMLDDEFAYHVINTSGRPMIHVATTRRAEVVVFGHDQRLKTPLVLLAGEQIIIKGEDDEKLTVSCFAPGEDDRREQCSAKIDDVIRTVVKVGGNYGDVVQLLQQAKSRNYLEGRLVFDALPRPGRKFRRKRELADGLQPAGEELALAAPGGARSPGR